MHRRINRTGDRQSSNHRSHHAAAVISAATLLLVLSCPELISTAVAATAGGRPRHPAQRQRVERPASEIVRDVTYTASSSSGSIDIDVTGNAHHRLAEELEDVEDHAARLRSDLLADYDLSSYPWDYAWSLGNDTSLRLGLSVEVGINFHRVHKVDIISSTLDLIVWFRQRWTDPRLRWDPSEYNNITTTWFWIGDGVGSAGETSEIWTPDLQLWNLDAGLEESLSDTYAVVSHEGVVFWSRPGHLRPACKYEGLDNFPFDVLTCTMEFGSWAYSGLYVRPEKMDGVGFSVGGSDTAGQAYSEFTLVKENGISCREHLYPPFVGAPEEDWPVLFYDVSLQRSWQPYMRGYILTQVILNFAGFSTFWLPVPCGERMSLAITSLLAAVASELVVASNLPSAAEITWFQQFSIFSLCFAALALFESVAVLYFFYHVSPDITPKWYKWIQNQRRQRRIKARKKERARALENIAADNSKNSLDATERVNNKTTGKLSNTSSEEGSPQDPCIDLTIPAKENANVGNGDEAETGAPAATSGGPNNESSTLPTPAQRPNLDNSNISNISNLSLVLNRPHDADDFANEYQAKHNLRWKKVANKIDEVSRVLVPTVYIIILSVMVAQVF